VAVYRRSARPRFVLLLLVLTAISLLTVDERGSRTVQRVRDRARDGFDPVHRAANAAFRPVGNFVEGALHYGDLEAENSRLREQLGERRATELQAADAQRELRALEAQANLEFAGDIPAVSARVASMAPSNFQQTIDINRGRSDGVGVGMPVVAGAGLVGRVVDASSSRSTVLLLTDPAFSVGVRLTGSGDVGVAAGKGPHAAMPVELIDAGTKVAKGEVVVTSGMQQSVFPPGIPVGTVVDAVDRPANLQEDVTITPVVDLRRLAFVKVLQYSSTPGRSTTGGSPAPATPARP